MVLALGLAAPAVAAAQQPEGAPPSPPEEGAQPAEGQPAEGQPAEGQPAEGQPAEGEEKPAEGETTEEEPAEPAAPPAAPPPAPAPEPTAPAATEPATGQGAQGSFTLGVPADEAEEGPDEPEEKDDRLPPRVPWRGTSINWGHSVTTTAVGIGRDNISDSHEMYNMSWSLLLNYYLADQEDYKVNVYIAPGFSVELTNSDWTTTEREPMFDDLPLGASYSRALYQSEGGDFVTAFSGSGVLIFPTSPPSYDSGLYLTTSPRLSLTQSFPLAGQDAPVFQSFAIGGSFRWDHQFSEATTAVNPDLQRPRQNQVGESFLSDQLSFGRIAHDTIREALFLSFPSQIGDMELTLSAAISMSQRFVSEFEEADCVVIQTGECVTPTENTDTRTSFNSIGFSASATFFPVPEAGMSLGYVNSSGQLGPDGTRRDFFYNPNAMFVGSVLISLDAIYERITGPPRAGSFVMAKNKNKRKPNSDATLLSF
ncbi:MAG: hypothetical protein JRI23_03960 [Deltaproteobacteria bacterium]|jgi:hypothetical protein|nr:hypothetical protein [Deltaproteobacteria bacterium]MBW2530684.1 hypothetical protein [Deltaproteobacteria bacterium]